MILTSDELKSLTGYQQPAAQIRALKKMDIFYRVRPDGHPVVTWDMVNGLDIQTANQEYMLNVA
ncbi:DUF4224 domain-containing protein [Solemya elarraichensis gill symbiont]|uniref:DUF4224 domain-containing protein n=1 Tax=Solemya elarraichensis gill symbiont TaxID=1918949 RepID=A0A1T2L3K8_9GAMM|nr:DUF4224 domain-containing protein [Solemya elarraichensis gill symbiont]OOZ39683.1 hypothetical protein BOW52_07005 [Solemya elarraichensis gill symbiont]